MHRSIGGIKAVAVLAWGLGICLLSGCPSGSAQKSPRDKPVLVTTTGMVTDLVRHVVGDRAKVVGLYGAVDPHLYAPTASDMIQIKEADVVFYSGLHLEGPMGTAFEARRRRDGKLFAVTDHLPADQVRTPEGSTGHPDPHVWHDPILWGECGLYVAEVMAEANPEHAAEYRENAKNYAEELKQLDAFAREVLGAIPESRRQLVTAHDAFEYFAARYGLEVRSIQGISTESQAGLYDVNRIVDLLVERKIPRIFIESTVNDKYIGQVIKGAESRGWHVEKGDVLYSDAMGNPGTYEGTYIGMLDHNIAAIASGLGAEWTGPVSYRESQEQSAEK